jgi:hypothetical protein
MTNERLISMLRKMGYFNVRELADGIVCCFQMLFTTAVIIEPNESGYERRYCYATAEEALACCNSMKSVDDPPAPGFKAIK